METIKTKYLDKVDSPLELKKLSLSQLPEYCQELREFIIQQVASNPGHLGSSLGALEIAVALQYVYDTPNDALIWDVGHQAYAHKIITGRRDRFYTNRQLGGLSGFPRMDESPYDAFGAGHASTSISAALGMAIAARLDGSERKVVAIIGDGSMSGGLAFEGLNNAGAQGVDLLVILNDNHIAIDPNVGALKEYLLRIATSKRYNRFKNGLWQALDFAPSLRRMLKSVGNSTKYFLLHHSNLFESLNFRYFGPIDGNDVVSLVKRLRDLRSIGGPKLLHTLTIKGKGYLPAEQNQTEWHAPGRFDATTGKKQPTSKYLRFQDVFGHTLLELAQQNPRIVGITPAMPTGSSLNIMMDAMPERAFDVGIAEGHAVTFAAGLAASGKMPFCNIYSSFAQRSLDNIIHDVAIQHLDVVLCLDRAGLVGEDGATHHGVFDVAMLRAVPNVIISAPSDSSELRNMMYTASLGGYHSAFVIRYPRGGEFDAKTWCTPMEKVKIGLSRQLRQGSSNKVILSFGAITKTALSAIELSGQDIALYDLRFAKPLDTALLDKIRNKEIFVVENEMKACGVASAIMEYYNSTEANVKIHSLGIDDYFVEQGSIAQLQELCGIDTQTILKAIK
ncbi:MAG: 1-deoxy-D-xylulose-5-phosphate synthase [Mucinivorans sp.]